MKCARFNVDRVHMHVRRALNDYGECDANDLHRDNLCRNDSSWIDSTQSRMMENAMTDVATRMVSSPIGETILVYDRETSMYLGHIVIDDDAFICTRIDAHDCVESHWRTNNYGAAKAYVECAMDVA